MEFRKMLTITLCTRQQKRHWCIEQSYGLCCRGRGWEDLGEWHWNMYNIIYETSCQSRFDARYWMLGAGALGWPREMVRGGRRVQYGEHVYACGRCMLIYGKGVCQKKIPYLAALGILSEKAMATHSSILAWRIPGMGSLVGCSLWGCTESDTTEVT